VLLELDEKEASERNEKTHHKRLSEIEGEDLETSLLQIKAANKDAAADLLASLMSSLDDLNETQEESEASLTETFDEEMNSSTIKHDKLVAEHAELNETLYHEVDLQHQLKAAVEHLKATRDALQDRTFALHKFADRVSTEDIDISLIQIAARKDDKVSIEVTTPGDGKTFPQAGDTLAMHYVGTLAKGGAKFDSSRDRDEPFSFQIGVGEVIQGWTRA